MPDRVPGFRELIRHHLALQEEREAAARQESLRATIAALDGQLQSAREAVRSAREEHERLRVERRGAESEVAALEQRRAKYRTQLMEAKTNEVYKALLSEIEHVGAAISDKETVILEFMEAIESTGRRVTETERALAESEASNTAEAKVHEASILRLTAAREDAAARARALLPAVPPELRRRLTRLAEAHDGRGMARVSENTCTDCHVTVRPQVWVNLLAESAIETCSGCGRILYRDESLAQPGPETGSEAGSKAGPEPGSEAGSKAGPEPGSEAGSKAGPEPGSEAAQEVGSEAGPEVGASATTEASGQVPTPPVAGG